ncbi:MAG: hypothetical protein HWE27_00380 [Gammaproteobacteria bacterium]|nr:hypothetical protein [Gammaproteobacteria bacterium]
MIKPVFWISLALASILCQLQLGHEGGEQKAALIDSHQVMAVDDSFQEGFDIDVDAAVSTAFVFHRLSNLLPKQFTSLIGLQLSVFFQPLIRAPPVQQN